MLKCTTIWYRLGTKKGPVYLILLISLFLICGFTGTCAKVMLASANTSNLEDVITAIGVKWPTCSSKKCHIH